MLAGLLLAPRFWRKRRALEARYAPDPARIERLLLDPHIPSMGRREADSARDAYREPIPSRAGEARAPTLSSSLTAKAGADEEWVYFVHGTTTGLWSNTSTIDPQRDNGDFGAGFYTFEDTRWGREAALAWTRRKVRTDRSTAILVRVRMDRGVFQALDREDVADDAFETVYRRYHLSELTGRELVVGPVGKRDGADRRRVPNRSLPLQYKFEGTGITRLIVDAILPADRGGQEAGE
jgi:hypothetical protein